MLRNQTEVSQKIEPIEQKSNVVFHFHDWGSLWQEGIHDAYSCIVIGGTKKGFYGKIPMGVSFCVPSQRTSEAVVTFHYGSDEHAEQIHLGFDAAEKVTIFENYR